MSAPNTSSDFDRAYRAPLTPWGDIRIPGEIKELTRKSAAKSVLELGCGIGRFTRHLAGQGLRATGVDFSPVAIEKARKRAGESNARYLVGDVTNLEGVTGPFDISFDVGCFHCLDPKGQRAYVTEVARLLVPGGTHLIWALDWSPSDLSLSPGAMRAIFAEHFTLAAAEKSRRRLVASHWYWLTRNQSLR